MTTLIAMIERRIIPTQDAQVFTRGRVGLLRSQITPDRPYQSNR